MKKEEIIIKEILKGMEGIGGIPTNQEFYNEFTSRLSFALSLKESQPSEGVTVSDEEIEKIFGYGAAWRMANPDKRIDFLFDRFINSNDYATHIKSKLTKEKQPDNREYTKEDLEYIYCMGYLGSPDKTFEQIAKESKELKGKFEKSVKLLYQAKQNTNN